jgi:hypothetical protein
MSYPTNLVDPLLHHVVDKITKLFETNGADSAFARKVALSALAAYHPESHADIVNIARILAFSMASLAALILAAADDLSPAQKIRYFGRANALNRSADQTERMMMQRRRLQRVDPSAKRPADSTPLSPIPPEQSAALEAMVDEAMATYRATVAAKPAPKPEPPAAPPQAERARPVLRAAFQTQPPATPYRRSLLNGSAMPQIPPNTPLPDIRPSA